MPARPSSNPKPARFTNAHMVATSFAAVAGVAIAAYQTLSPTAAPPQQPVQVTLAVESPAAIIDVPVAKGDAVQAGPFDIGQGAQFSAALKDGAEQRYSLSDLFDGKPETSLSIVDPDRELNVLVSFAGDVAQPVNLIEYVPPTGNFGAAAITPGESWVTDSEFLISSTSHPKGADGTTWLGRVQWSKPNQLIK